MVDERPPEQTILLVEDNQLNQMVAQGMLRLLGLTADLAQNGVEAVEALRAKHYETVLMDISMPELDGLDATRQIRAGLPRDAQPYIIALTANAMSGDRDRCLQAGMDDYLSKPLTKEALSAALRRSTRRPAR